MSKLTAEQQKLVEDNIAFCYYTVNKLQKMAVRWGVKVSLDEIVSCVHITAVRAALTWRPDGGSGFCNYLFQSAKRNFSDYVKERKEFPLTLTDISNTEETNHESLYGFTLTSDKLVRNEKFFELPDPEGVVWRVTCEENLMEYQYTIIIPDDYWPVVVGVLFEGKTQTQIAKELGRTKSEINRRYTRAVDSILYQISEYRNLCN